jgi:two-component system sensor histidine kinase PhoQ
MSVLLVLFFGITIVALDYVFRDLTHNAMRQRLEVQLIALITASEEDSSGGLRPSTQHVEATARFNTPGSGLYGEIMRSDGYPSWRSISLTGTGLVFPTPEKYGEPHFGQLTNADGSNVLALSRKLEWQFDSGETRSFVYSVAEDLGPYYAQLNGFRGRMFGWFGVLMLLLLGAIAMLVRRLLAPLRKVEKEIAAIEVGELTELGTDYPRELQGVTANLNTLLRGERERLARYRNTLGNLAHSFKTPLAVMRNLLSSEGFRDLPAARQLDEQVTRMNDIVKYQLKRAAASGSTGLGMTPVDVKETLDALRGALLKVYIERNIRCTLDVTGNALFYGDREDLQEIAGNLLDNAFKWAKSEIRLTVATVSAPNARRDGLVMIFEDDGPGIPESRRTHVLERGARLDERVSGQGIGLSIVRELVGLNGGTIEIGTSALGGASVEVRLPPS